MSGTSPQSTTVAQLCRGLKPVSLWVLNPFARRRLPSGIPVRGSKASASLSVIGERVFTLPHVHQIQRYKKPHHASRRYFDPWTTNNQLSHTKFRESEGLGCSICQRMLCSSTSIQSLRVRGHERCVKKAQSGVQTSHC